MATPPPSKKHIVVIGAGITGLTSAKFLAEAGYAVTIVAKYSPGDKSIDYTSPWAGGHWHPASTSKEPLLCDFDLQTYAYWLDLLKKGPLDSEGRLLEAGLKLQTSHHFWDNEDPNADLWWAPHVKNFRQLGLHEEPIRGVNERTAPNAKKVVWGVELNSPSFSTPQYLQYIQASGVNAGVQLIKASLPTDKGLAGVLAAAEKIVLQNGRPKPDAFVNATGLAAGVLCGDAAVHPNRGQTVLVRGEAACTRTRRGHEYTTYCIPRPGSNTTILGGTRDRGNWDPNPTPAITERILRENAVIAPELLTGSNGGFEIISVQVGRRPVRDGGPRIEREVVGGKKVVHAYGHSGAGYQLSVGSARMVVKLTQQSLEGSEARL